jgi:hypothetical protein
MPAVHLVMLIEFTNRTSACLAILLMALFSGCASGVPEGDPAPQPRYGLHASPELLDACERAAGRWYDATGLEFSCTVDRKQGGMWVIDCPEDAEYGGWSAKGAVPICRAMLGEMLDLVVTHEIGHQLRPGGHPDNGSLMCWRPASANAPISAEDLSWVCEGAHCTWFQPEGYADAPCSPEP